MEPAGEEIIEKEYQELTVDYSRQSLKRIERASKEEQLAVTLIMDDNEIQRLDNLETYINLNKLSLVNNHLVRMYGVSQSVLLQELDLSSNSLVFIEGLKDLSNLKHLNLAKNRIKTIEHLNNNLKLERVDLSENNIMHISDISFLENLKELNLHGNRISHLRNCEKNLPANLEILTLNNNSLTDLNEISHLVHLTVLKELTIANNPCLDFSEDQKFNYRPFVKNWCSSLMVLDNCPLDDIECLKAEWLYSQGRGRSFRPGEHAALVEYLMSVCPREAGEEAETEDVKKLKLILSKAQLHQQQLRAQLSTGKFSPIEAPRSSSLKKKPSVLGDRMVASFQESTSRDCRSSSDLMTRSLDSGMIRKTSKMTRPDTNHTPLQTSTTFIPIPDTLISPDVGQPMCTNQRGPSSISSRTSRSSSRNSPYSTPESKRKTSTTSLRKQDNTVITGTSKKQGKLFNSKSSFPLSSSFSAKGVNCSGGKGNNARDLERNCRETSEDEDSEVLAMKIRAIQFRVNQRRQNKMHQMDAKKSRGDGKEAFETFKKKSVERALRDSEAWRAAVCIQRWWRGFRARNLDKDVLIGCKDIQLNRMQDYIIKVMHELEATKVALEGNRKLVVLQMQAINGLWKKITALQPVVASSPADDRISLQNLVETCSNLNKQMEALQAMMKTMQNSGSSIPTATQTEIVAVHTPQIESRKSFFYTSQLQDSELSVENRPCFDSMDDEIQNCRTNNSDHASSTTTVKDVSVENVSTVLKSAEEKGASLFSDSLAAPFVKITEDNREPVSSPTAANFEKSSNS